MFFESFYPKRYERSAYRIDYEKLYEEGYRGIIFDIDNTLVAHGADATPEAIELFSRLKAIGFDICLLSNNKKPRVERFIKDINIKYIFHAQKPYSKNYLAAALMMRCGTEQTICIGDQLFTDIYGANNCGMYSILVKSVSKINPVQVKIKKVLEKPIILMYFNKIRKERREARKAKKLMLREQKSESRKTLKSAKKLLKAGKKVVKAQIKADKKIFRDKNKINKILLRKKLLIIE